MTNDRLRVLFLCTHNSARSQMAEGLLRHVAGDRFDVHSAGTEATFVRPDAIAAMDEIGIDIRGHQSKTLERYLGQHLDWLITVCDQAREACPVVPGVRNQRHWSIEDPAGHGLGAFRQARDELRERIGEFVDETGRPPAG